MLKRPKRESLYAFTLVSCTLVAFLASRVQSALLSSKSPPGSTTKKIMDSSNLRLEYCDSCDIFLGGLFPVHAPQYQRQTQSAAASSPPTLTQEQQQLNVIDLKNLVQSQFQHNEIFPPTSCGEIKKERGIQRLEAMLFAIDLVNNSSSLLPHLRLGARIFDDCDRDTIALEKCVHFVSDYFLLNDESVVNDFSCSASSGPGASIMRAYRKTDVINRRRVIGVIGAASSSVSIQVANLLRLFQVPQISYASTSPDLSFKDRFPFFSRVLPSDTLQAEAMANLVYELDWNYIATIKEVGNFGGIDSFNTFARAKRICISGSYTLSQTASEDDVKAILTELYKQQNARGVVMFLQDHNIRKLLRLVKTLNMTGHFLWVASDSWGTKKESIDSNDEEAEGAITFSPKSYEIQAFNEYFKKLKPRTNTRNPWFHEFWEEQFNCTMDKYVSYSNHRRLNRHLCSGEESLNITQDSFIHFVIDSVYAMAHAIEKIMDSNCKHHHIRAELIKCQRSVEMKGPELLNEIRKVEFQSITGRTVRFIEGGDGIAPYEVFQYQLLDAQKGKYGYKKITEWEKDKKFKLDPSMLKWPQSTSKHPRSVCKDECLINEIKQGDDCCWVCVKCEENQFVAPGRKECITCDKGYGPNNNKTDCEKLPIEYLTFNSPFTIVPVIFATLGTFFTCYTIYVFIRFSNTPIIKASGRELCYVLLAGIMSCYLVTFPLVTKPTTISCFLLRFGVSLSLTTCLSALFTKTNRLSRIFNSSMKQVRQAAYVSPQSQLVICFSLIAFQVVGIIIWTGASSPGTFDDTNDPKRVILMCKTNNTHLAASFAYNMFLVVLCTIYAVKTRKIPENFNEARFIGFTMYSICIIWTAFIAIYFGTTAAATAGSSKPKNNYKIQLTTLAMCLSLSATVILFCLFLPKLRVVLLKPDKNVRSKSSNIVKSVYKSHQSKSQDKKDSSSGGIPTQTTQNLHQPHSNTNPYPTTALTTTEKSLTLGTGVSSSASTPSSPGGSHLHNRKQIKLQPTNSFPLEPTKEPILVDNMNMNEDISRGEGVTSALTTAIDSLHDLSFKIFAVEKNLSLIPTDRLSESSMDTLLLKKDATLSESKEDLESWVRKKMVKRSQSEDVNDLLIDATHKPDIIAVATGDSYEYFVLEPRSRNGGGVKTSASAIEFKSLTSSNHSPQPTAVGLTPTTTIPEIITTASGETPNNEETLFNEDTIRSVVEKCFHQIAKNKRITSPCLYLKQQQPEIKLIKVNPFGNQNNHHHNHHEKKQQSQQNQQHQTNPGKDSGIVDPNNSTDQIVNSSSLSSLCSSSGTTTASSSLIDANNNNTISINKNSLRQTVVEKMGDLLHSAPTNTILLTGGGLGGANAGAGGDELYSLKITFV